MGDCFTLRAPGVLVEILALRRPLRGADVVFGAGSPLRSTGDAVVPVYWFCASSAGEVRGLKKSSALSYCGKLNPPLSGVWAGDTKGVKETFLYQHDPRFLRSRLTAGWSKII